jgi:predicted aspartyl protease
MTTVAYTGNYPYVGNRPYADVVLHGPSGAAPTYKCLVDTGADYLQLPSAAASLAGLAGGSPLTVSGSTGSTTMTLMKGVTVEIEGKRVAVDVLFDPSGSSRALLGRQALLAAYDAGFNVSEWLSV